MASTYYTDILAHVQTEFPTADGYSTIFQTDFATFLDTYVVPLVDPALPLEEQDINLANAFAAGSPGNYDKAFGTLKLKFYTNAEWTINLVKGDNSSPSSSSKLLFGRWSQAGAFAPAFTAAASLVNSYGEIPIWLRGGPGTYTIGFTTFKAFDDINKANLVINSLFDDVSYQWAIVDDYTAAIVINQMSSNIGTGDWIATPADSIVTGATIQIETFQ